MNYDLPYNKFIFGIAPDSDISDLLKKGVKKFFFGYIPPDFIKKYSTQVSINRRYRDYEQFTDIEAVHKVIDIIHSQNGIIDLALNPMHFNNKLFSIAVDVFNQLKNKIDGVIVSNITLANYLKRENYKNIVISNLFGLYNIEAIKFIVKQFNPIRIIMPRDVSIDYIQKVAKIFSDIDIEIFLYGDSCRYSESCCYPEHGYDSIFFNNLCSYTFENIIPIKRPVPHFKQYLFDKKISYNERKELVSNNYLDIDSLMTKLAQSYENQNFNLFSKYLKYISEFDENYLSIYYYKLKFFLNGINHPLCETLLDKLKKSDKFNYNAFHKLNLEAIKRTIKIFEEFDNIYFKIPSRGREFNLKDGDYKYRESQYLL